MTLDSQTALHATRVILGIGLAIQSLEILTARQSHAPLCAGKHPLGFATQWLNAKMIVRLALAGVLILGPGKYLSVIEPVLWMSLILSSAGLIVRFGGPLGGGSDSMFFQAQIGMLIASFGAVNPTLVRVGLGWIAAQSVLSYALAGISKLRNENWRNGGAMQTLLRSNGPYTLFAPVRSLANSKSLCMTLSTLIALFEISFPWVLILPQNFKLAILAAGLTFHITNAVVLGLNRFIWAWLATYPALLFFA